MRRACAHGSTADRGHAYDRPMSEHDANEMITLLRGLRATRSFTDEPVEPGALDDILQVARWTGSSMNDQEWQLVVVTDRSTLTDLAATSQTAGHLARAPLGIAVVMPGERKITEAFDEARMVERIMLAARARGLASGMAWVSGGEDEAKRLLGIPPERRLRTVVAIGHPDEAGSRRKAAPGSARRPLAETVHYERWGQRTP